MSASADGAQAAIEAAITGVGRPLELVQHVHSRRSQIENVDRVGKRKALKPSHHLNTNPLVRHEGITHPDDGGPHTNSTFSR